MYLGSDYHKENLLKASCKSGEVSRRRKEERVLEYNKTPVKCMCCQITLSYKERRKRFCTSSCAAKFNNQGRVRTEESKERQRKRHREKIPLSTRITYSNCCVCNNLFVKKSGRKKKTCSNLCKDKVISNNSRNNINCGGFRLSRRQGGHYFCKESGENVYLDSSWEIRYAKWLDKNNIKWIRPKYLIWTDVLGLKHRYTADFYLTETQEYIDVKNDYLLGLESTKDKFFRVESENKLTVKVITKNILLDLEKQ